MKSRIRKMVAYIVLLTLLVFTSSFVEINALATTSSEAKMHCDATIEDNFDPQTVVVTMKQNVQNIHKQYSLQDFPEIDAVEFRDMTKGISDNVTVANNELIAPSGSCLNMKNFHRIFALTLRDSTKQKVLDAISVLQLRNDILSVEPNYLSTQEVVVQSIQGEQGDGHRSDVNSYANQVYIDNIQLEEAWELATGSSEVSVGIIEYGIDNTHPALQQHINEDLSECFVSDASQSTTVEALWANPHGTQVAGIIGASPANATNGIVAGVAHGVSLISLRIETDDGLISSANIANAIIYASQCGIDILNISYQTHESTALYVAISSYSGLCVCSAGNERDNLDDSQEPERFPSCMNLPNIISVGNCTLNDEVAELSNYGRYSVDLFAPGQDIVCTYPQSLCGTGCVPEIHKGYGYHTNSGTSFAAPFVTGTAALILSKYPTISPTCIRKSILNGVDSVAGLSNFCYTGGRLNVYKALLEAGTNHDHSLVRINDEVHSYSCECNEYYTENHSYTQQYASINPSLHYAYCKCSDSIVQQHGLSFVDNIDGTHTGTCVCGYVTSALPHNLLLGKCSQCSYEHPHVFTHSYLPFNNTYHVAKCECGASQRQQHMAVIRPGDTSATCVHCGATFPVGTIVPVRTNASSSSKK